MGAKRLLVVDDEPDFGAYMRDVAEGLDYEVRVTTNAKAFMQAYADFDPTTIVLDVVMPDVDGIELLQWLTKQDCTAQIIVVTGYNPNYASLATTLGEVRGLKTASLSKPVGVEALRAFLR